VQKLINILSFYLSILTYPLDDVSSLSISGITGVGNHLFGYVSYIISLANEDTPDNVIYIDRCIPVITLTLVWCIPKLVWFYSCLNFNY
jgi:hypothetical protein